MACRRADTPTPATPLRPYGERLVEGEGVMADEALRRGVEKANVLRWSRGGVFGVDVAMASWSLLATWGPKTAA